jgi:hypothetical protein
MSWHDELGDMIEKEGFGTHTIHSRKNKDAAQKDSRIAALEAEVAELITVMHGIVRMAEICHLEWGDMRLDKITNLARAAIAKVKEAEE